MVMSHCGSALIVCDDQNRAQVIGEVAANWVSRLLGDVQVYHVTSAQSCKQLEAVRLIVETQAML